MRKTRFTIFPAPKFSLRRFLKILGPGLITGAADDDPSGIATYAQSGAQFGLGQLWTVLFTYPLMTAVQETCARIGAVTGKGLAAVVKQYYAKPVLYGIVIVVAIANIINIGADIGAMTAAFLLIFHAPFVLTAVFFTVIMLLLEIFTSYKLYSRILKWLAITLLAYAVTAFIIGLNWKEVIIATVVPHIEFTKNFLFLIIGVLGTTISPYMFFWQASEEVEEEINKRRLAKNGGKPTITQHFMATVRLDNLFGMFISQITTWFIIVVAAGTLHIHGISNINTAADAAKALEPLVNNFPNAGFIAKIIFSAGVIGLGLLAVPVLAGATSYALSETFGWKKGLDEKFKRAKEFYAIIIVATFAGLLMNFIGIDPIKALIFSAVFNGIAAVPLLFIIAQIGSNKRIMGQYKSSTLISSLVWITFVAMGVGVVALLVSFVIK